MTTEEVFITKYKNSVTTLLSDSVALEEPLEIRVAWSTATGAMQRVASVLMRSPGNEKQLIAGFSFTEGIITDPCDIENITMAGGDNNQWTLKLKEGIIPVLNNLQRNFYSTSSCGICGKASIEAIRTPIHKLTSKPVIQIPLELLLSLPEKLSTNQHGFALTGGVHGCALFSSEGQMIDLQEDIGRHNALDKLIGNALFRQTELADKILILSGRAGFELLQKAAVAGLQVVASIGAPSSLAIELAKEFNITLAGFMKAHGMNVYSGFERIIKNDTVQHENQDKK